MSEATDVDRVELDRQANRRLPQELKHECVADHRYTGTPGAPRAYQVTFDQTWVPYDYLRHSDCGTEKWEIIGARIDWPKRKLFGKIPLPLGPSRLTITVKERARYGATCEAPEDQ